MERGLQAEPEAISVGSHLTTNKVGESKVRAVTRSPVRVNRWMQIQYTLDAHMFLRLGAGLRRM